MGLTDQLPRGRSIAAIEAFPIRLPLDTPLRWGKHSQLPDLRHVIIRVMLDDGSAGWAEAPPRPTIYGETVSSVLSIIAEEIKPRLLMQPLTAAPALLAEIKNNQTARGAVDMALHDAAAASQGMTLRDYLSSEREEIVVSYILGLGGIEETLAEAGRVYEQGVRLFKVKVGRRWDEDLARLRAIRANFGADLSLYADANECFSAADAAEKLARLADLGLLYCEEPLPTELISARAALRQTQRLPLVADDSAFDSRDLTRELSFDTFDILNIKTARTGYTESAAMLAAATEAGKGVMIGSQASSALGTARAGLFAARAGVTHPSELSFFLKCREDVVNQRPAIIAGRIKTADLAAVKIDETRLRQARFST